MQSTQREIEVLEGPGADCDVHEDNQESLVAFLGCETQWRLVSAGMGAVWLGLDYAAVAAYLRTKRFTLKRQGELMDDLMIMERAALPVLNAPRGKGSSPAPPPPPRA